MAAKGVPLPLELRERMKAIAAARAVPFEVRYWQKVDKRGPDECWPWLGACAGKSPRGAIWNGKKVLYAHRVAWTLAGNELPVWPMVIDHMCRNGLCQNPRHLRVVSQRTNTIENSDSPFAKNHAKTHCDHGHPLSGDNLLIEWKVSHKAKLRGSTTKTPQRICLACRKRRADHWNRINRAKARAAREAA